MKFFKNCNFVPIFFFDKQTCNYPIYAKFLIGTGPIQKQNIYDKDHTKYLSKDFVIDVEQYLEKSYDHKIIDEADFKLNDENCSILETYFNKCEKIYVHLPISKDKEKAITIDERINK